MARPEFLFEIRFPLPLGLALVHLALNVILRPALVRGGGGGKGGIVRGGEGSEEQDWIETERGGRGEKEGGGRCEGREGKDRMREMMRNMISDRRMKEGWSESREAFS